MVLPNPNNGGTTIEPHRFSQEIDSNCSTPYVSAPSSPGRGPSGYFFSAPASPMHYVLSSTLSSQPTSTADTTSFEFEFSSRFSEDASIGPGSMSSADELFCNGQIRPMKLSSHLQRPQFLAPLLDSEVEEDDGGENCQGVVMRGRDLRSRNRSMHRKTRSMSPLRNSPFRWPEDDNDDVNLESDVVENILDLEDKVVKEAEVCTAETTPSTSASSSRSSSSGRNSKKWIFLKDFLYRSKSEGRANAKEKFWSSLSFSPAKEKHTNTTPSDPVSSTINTRKALKKQVSTTNKPANGVAKRRPVSKSAHELHYTANRAQAEEMKKKTYLPYRQGLFGCLGFSSKSYGAFNGFSRTLNPVSSGSA